MTSWIINNAIWPPFAKIRLFLALYNVLYSTIDAFCQALVFCMSRCMFFWIPGLGIAIGGIYKIVWLPKERFLEDFDNRSVLWAPFCRIGACIGSGWVSCHQGDRKVMPELCQFAWRDPDPLFMQIIQEFSIEQGVIYTKTEPILKRSKNRGP